MTSRLVDLPSAEGELLAAAIVEAGGKKILARGHRLERADLPLLRQKGLREVWVVALAGDDRSESEVLSSLAPPVASGPIELRPAPGGRLDLIAMEPSALVLHSERMRIFNQNGAAVISTLPNFSLVNRGDRFAVLRSLPFSAPGEQVDQLRAELQTGGPLIEIMPIREPKLSVVFTDPANPERARDLFEPIVRRRIERLGVTPQYRTSLEEQTALTYALTDALRRRPDVILIASTISPLIPTDVIGQAIGLVGGGPAHFLAPVEPGSLLLLAYAGETAIVVATGCFRSAKPNVLDLILPPLLARYPLTPFDIASLGAGGLLG